MAGAFFYCNTLSTDAGERAGARTQMALFEAWQREVATAIQRRRDHRIFNKVDRRAEQEAERGAAEGDQNRNGSCNKRAGEVQDGGRTGSDRVPS